MSICYDTDNMCQSNVGKVTVCRYWGLPEQRWHGIFMGSQITLGDENLIRV